MPYPNLTLTIYKKKKRFDAKCSFKTKIFRNELHASFYPFSVKSMFQFIWSYGGKKIEENLDVSDQITLIQAKLIIGTPSL